MRLGGPAFSDSRDPETLALAHVKKGYRASTCAPFLKAGDTAYNASYVRAFFKHDVQISEVGAWKNALSLDEKEGKEAVAFFEERLALADELGAKCCVGIIGTWDTRNWYAPNAANFTQDFFDYAVQVHRRIIDAVKPTRTKMTYEIMPYGFLDGAASYLKFLEALDRKEQTGVHLDLTNCISSVRQYMDHRAYLGETIRALGPQIVSVHVKDLRIRPEPLQIQMDEVPIGSGEIDYRALLPVLERSLRQPKDTALILEHLSGAEQYDRAAENLRAAARDTQIEW